jgi:phosphoglycerol transferase MdoB-like AlkP superfamily enzyme
MGLYPDFSRAKDAASFYASRNSYLPFCLGNAFQEQKGIQSYGYHNHIGQYYGRRESHPNMGYIMKFSKDGLDMGLSWPTSDLEMMKQSVDDYIRGDQQFHAYYMTFSGHMLYYTHHNAIAKQNWDLVKNVEGLSDMSKCYLACNIELDRALAYLMERLEEAGVADKTAIVLAGDHYPYGLYDHMYAELLDYEPDELTKNKSSLLFWVGGLEENIVVDEYCCNADILPTVLNLWGFDFDSRMLAGTDVFSDGTHVAILRDRSFLTEKVWLNASTGEIRFQVDESEVPENYVEDMIRLVQTKFALSSDILNQAYYNYIFSKEAVVVGREVWGENPDR